jgi:hypothetical protein
MTQTEKKLPPFVEFVAFGCKWISYQGRDAGEFFLKSVDDGYHMRQMAIGYKVDIQPWMDDRIVAQGLRRVENEYLSELCKSAWAAYA